MVEQRIRNAKVVGSTPIAGTIYMPVYARFRHSRDPLPVKKLLAAALLLPLIAYGGYRLATQIDPNPNRTVGEVVDSLHGVDVFYNGGVNHVEARNLAHDGYNIGLKYQCVEFVKRYYYQHLNHKMPDSYGHAKDFFNSQLASGEINPQRNLRQYHNGEGALPAVGDILVYSGSVSNPYGHVAIVSAVDAAAGSLEIIQQNPGPFASSRAQYALTQEAKGWRIDHSGIMGWLHKE